MFHSLWRRLGGTYESTLPIEGCILPSPTTTSSSSSSSRSSSSSTISNNQHIAVLVHQQLCTAICTAITTYGGQGMHLLGMDCMVEFSNTVCKTGMFTPTGKVNDANIRTAWCLQTPDGAEISIMLIVDKHPQYALNNSPNTVVDAHISDTNWTGRLIVRSSDAATAQTLCADADHLVYALTAGCAWLA